ncbi:class I SAM-dependent methyltransferase [Leifsonia kafniensis]|uniref:Class I SAM-dependent methyltransferase n=1 Tax=Leifsonia kafniensis TaxID=475957 RepID=A0ABP7KGN7_9MICO
MTSTSPVSVPPAFVDQVSWLEGGQQRTALWRSDGGWPAPTTVVIADDAMTADAAYRLVSAGTALLWRGDFSNARQLLSALGRRIDKRNRPTRTDLATAFRTYRADAATRARLLGLILVPLDADYTVPLRRAPAVREACLEVFGPADNSARGPSLIALRELLGVIGAHEWRREGVPVAALGARIHPHYGVFSPVRGEYLDLVAQAPLPAAATAPGGVAFDIGAGTGVLSAILAQRGVTRVIGTDLDPRALACATENITRLGLAEQVEVVRADLFAPGVADLIVCNPPWIPAPATTSTDHAVYDPDSRMLRGFLAGLAEHLSPGGEGWLIISDIAERLGLRSRGELLDLIEDAGLTVVARLDTRPTHPKAVDTTDPLHAARAAEVTSLWRLAAA